MAKLNNNWSNAFEDNFETEEVLIEFIFDRLDTKDFEDSYVCYGNVYSPNECFKVTAENKRQNIYDFLIDLVERANKIQ